ncbi:MAG: putative GTP-binding protein EngB [Syntrophaceae bacterium PtaU1.Bin231]|nr:MAG: putative GTP-binding protein EngB [Syntrophaceae bacterium PtaU1.Bin231]HOG17459.1 ribosome biogenesis GTP-binding protein YihA/YsxC [Syntrophales bacterium]
MSTERSTFVKSATAPAHYPPDNLPEVAFAGRSNVGKSSLINVLLGRKNLARTGSTPGCTQTLNFFLFEGRLSIADLPGYGYARVSHSVRAQWKDVVETYLQQRSSLRLVIFVMDIRRDPADGDLDLLAWLRRGQRETLVVLTKIDKLSRSEQKERSAKILLDLEPFGVAGVVLFSAKTGEGRDALWKKINKSGW